MATEDIRDVSCQIMTVNLAEAIRDFVESGLYLKETLLYPDLDWFDGIPESSIDISERERLSTIKKGVAIIEHELCNSGVQTHIAYCFEGTGIRISVEFVKSVEST